jgi:hypothetical protein
VRLQLVREGALIETTTISPLGLAH